MTNRRRRRGTSCRPTSRTSARRSATAACKAAVRLPAGRRTPELDAARFDALSRTRRRPSRSIRSVASRRSTSLGAVARPALADLDAISRRCSPRRPASTSSGSRRRRSASKALLASGAQARAIGELEPLLARHPLRERLWGLLMLAFYREGRQAEALNAYQRAREILADELGIDPSPELARLHERILRQDPGLELRGEPLRGYRLLEKIGSRVRTASCSGRSSPTSGGRGGEGRSTSRSRPTPRSSGDSSRKPRPPPHSSIRTSSRSTTTGGSPGRAYVVVAVPARREPRERSIDRGGVLGARTSAAHRRADRLGARVRPPPGRRHTAECVRPTSCSTAKGTPTSADFRVGSRRDRRIRARIIRDAREPRRATC